MARIRTTFGSHANTAHVWAQQTHERGRAADGRVFFEGPTIYSHGTHYAIARFTDARFQGRRVVLLNSTGYSNSTSKHTSHVQRALHGLPVEVLAVADPATGQDEHNVMRLAKKFDAVAESLASTRKVQWGIPGWDDPTTVEKRIAALDDATTAIRTYCRAFKIKLPYMHMGEKRAAIQAAYDRHNDPALMRSRARAQARRELAYADAAAKFYAWKEGVYPIKDAGWFGALPKKLKDEARQIQRREEHLLYRYERARQGDELTPAQWMYGQGHASQDFDETLCRRKDDRLETSRGAVVPWQHALAVFFKAQRCRQSAKSWHRNGEQVPIGHFQLDSIDADGSIRAGCHIISFAEMLRLAVREIPGDVRPTFPVPALVEG